MRFLDRTDEVARLRRVLEAGRSSPVVVYGRRRIGKTRLLLLEWSSQADGLYTVADQSAAEIHRRYFAAAVAARLPGFADVEYRTGRDFSRVWPGTRPPLTGVAH